MKKAGKIFLIRENILYLHRKNKIIFHIMADTLDETDLQILKTLQRNATDHQGIGRCRSSDTNPRL